MVPEYSCPNCLELIIKESGYTYEIGGMSMAIEMPDLDALFRLVKKVHQAHVDEGGQRIVIDLKVDDRKDKDATIGSKRNAVKFCGSLFNPGHRSQQSKLDETVQFWCWFI